MDNNLNEQLPPKYHVYSSGMITSFAFPSKMLLILNIFLLTSLLTESKLGLSEDA